MKNLKNIFIILLILGLSACNDEAFFKLQRPTPFPWNNVSELEFAAVSPYNKMFYGGYGAPFSNNVLNQLMESDYFRWVGNVEGYSTDQIYNRRFTERVSDIENLYGTMYQVIGLCNDGLDFYKATNDNPFPLASSTDKEKNVKRIKGELLFMRAYAYYTLAITFCPAYGYGSNNDTKILVKRDHTSNSSTDALNNAPATTGEIYDMIVNDLKAAKTLLPTDWTDGTHVSYKNRGRANKWAAEAFLAQVYFTMKKFTVADAQENALAELDSVINNGGYSLSTDPFANFNNSSSALLSSENQEVIFWMFQGDNTFFPIMNNSMRYTMFNKDFRDSKNGGNGNVSTGTNPKWSFTPWWQMCLAKSSLVEMGWMQNDGTETDLARWDLRYNNPTTTSGYVNEKGLYYRFEGSYTDASTYTSEKGLNVIGRRTNASDDGKYIISAKYGPLIGKSEPVVLVNKYFRTTAGNLQNIPLIRLSELYLNRAMIKKHAGISGWSSDFNKVASRSWNATLAGTAYVPKSDADISERMILVERWKEMAAEDTWYLPFCEALGYSVGLGDRASGSGFTAPYSSNYWQNCIPLSELDFQKR